MGIKVDKMEQQVGGKEEDQEDNHECGDGRNEKSLREKICRTEARYGDSCHGKAKEDKVPFNTHTVCYTVTS